MTKTLLFLYSKKFLFIIVVRLFFYLKYCILINIGNEQKSRCVLPLYYIAIAMGEWGGVYGRIFTIPNYRIYDFNNYKRSLIDSYIHNVDE